MLLQHCRLLAEHALSQVRILPCSVSSPADPPRPHCSCQQPIGNGTGYDAGVGAYQDYLGSCSNPQSFKLPTDIQTAVCNEKIKIANDIYSNGWEDGSWF